MAGPDIHTRPMLRGRRGDCGRVPHVKDHHDITRKSRMRKENRGHARRLRRVEPRLQGKTCYIYNNDDMNNNFWSLALSYATVKSAAAATTTTD
ncbi:hypothetical protein GH714_025794 [Hevea brasiliensis]|uniref:Uncharacterized protein n=1 Tax=Hevea brasiliensis TaxID=3981 RepID=A0A6A6NJA6_HEVBR|nr:hypothetical protein GH714_025794 [Hevea brasiliensis]